MITIIITGYNLDFEYITSRLALINQHFMSTKLRRLKHCSISGEIITDIEDDTLHGIQNQLTVFLSKNINLFKEIKSKFSHLTVQILIEYTNYYSKDGSQAFTFLNSELIGYVVELEIIFGLKSVANIVDVDEYVKYMPKIVTLKCKHQVKDLEENSHLLIDISKYHFQFMRELCRSWLELYNKLGHGHRFLCLCGKEINLIFDTFVNRLIICNINKRKSKQSINNSLFIVYRTMINFIYDELGVLETNNNMLHKCHEEAINTFSDIIQRAKRSSLSTKIKKEGFLPQSLIDDILDPHKLPGQKY